ncbi:MAG TPA: Zn-dependent hydrolase [Ktedonobacterales bacterium]
MQPSETPIAVDAALVERLLLELAQFGACETTGVSRTVYSPEWVAAQNQYAAWCAEAGLRVRRDAVGNVWGRLDGAFDGDVIVSGSHIDSQRPGGRYDGALGVISGLVALRTLKERFGAPQRSLECVSFCEEEGSRFPGAAFWGSRAVTGGIQLGEAEQLRGYDGVTMAEAMGAVGLDAGRITEAARNDIDTYIELHIEQGPVLEQAGLPAAIVNAITGLRHYEVELRGRADHAGAAPMDWRLDPMAGAAEIITGVTATAQHMGRPAVTTVGRLLVEPNGAAIVPEKVTFTIDARHPDPVALHTLFQRHEELITAVAQRRGLELSIRVIFDHPPCPADPELVRTLEQAAREQGIPTLTMHSGAGHDAQVMAQKARMAMIFVQSKGGRSHTPAEYTSIEHAVAGIQILTAALHKLAY